ncbi:transposase [Bacteroides pyogenes]|uniref:transposase n=1 Tax=Bacteroides pyogenes TaxID=310300 RepID=UPI003B42EC8A
MTTALIIATGEFTYFDNAKQLSRYIGICPTIERSRGKSGKPAIIAVANELVRQAFAVVISNIRISTASFRRSLISPSEKQFYLSLGRWKSKPHRPKTTQERIAAEYFSNNLRWIKLFPHFIGFVI